MNTVKNSNHFEAHSLSGKTLPFIFHLNNRTRTQGSMPYLHWHPNTEFLYITSGEGIVLIGNNEYAVSEGDIITVNSNLIHSMYTNTVMEYFCLIPDVDFCTSNDIDTENLVFDTLIKDESALALYSNVITAFLTGGKFRNASIRSAVLNLLLYLAEKHSEAADGAKKADVNEDIKLAVGYMKSHFHERLTLDELSCEVGLSKYYFVRKFKSCIGCTPIEYINRLRCERAKKLLAKDREIGEISELCGFDNFSYFSKTFKTITGTTPSQYRKSLS